MSSNSNAGQEGTHTYQYDALGRRVAKTVHDQTNNTNSTTIFVNARKGSMGQVLAEYTAGTTTLLRKFIYGEYIDEPLTMLDYTAAGSSPTGIAEQAYYHLNHNYTILGLTNNTGATAELYHYTSHGKRTVLNSTGINIFSISYINNNVSFTGRDLDVETGLLYFRARMFSSSTGSFVSRDPLHYVDGKNEYLGYFIPGEMDPRGEWTVCTCRRETGRDYELVINPTLDSGSAPTICKSAAGCGDDMFVGYSQDSSKPGYKDCSLVLYDGGDPGGQLLDGTPTANGKSFWAGASSTVLRNGGTPCNISGGFKSCVNETLSRCGCVSSITIMDHGDQGFQYFGVAAISDSDRQFLCKSLCPGGNVHLGGCSVCKDGGDGAAEDWLYFCEKVGKVTGCSDSIYYPIGCEPYCGGDTRVFPRK